MSSILININQKQYAKIHKSNKANIKDIPENEPIVYRLLNNSNNELYTGIAKRNRIQDRLLEHLNIQKEKISGATKLKLHRLIIWRVLKKIEKKLLKQLQPKFNVKDK
jgi:predicted GIY-YIG superfamily endonuclease